MELHEHAISRTVGGASASFRLRGMSCQCPGVVEDHLLLVVKKLNDFFQEHCHVELLRAQAERRSHLRASAPLLVGPTNRGTPSDPRVPGKEPIKPLSNVVSLNLAGLFGYILRWLRAQAAQTVELPFGPW